MRGGQIREHLPRNDVKTLRPRQRRVVANLVAQIHFRHATIRGHIFFQQLKIVDRFIEISTALGEIKVNFFVVRVKILTVLRELGITVESFRLNLKSYFSQETVDKASNLM